jgi:hypothetical protein
MAEPTPTPSEPPDDLDAAFDAIVAGFTESTTPAAPGDDVAAPAETGEDTGGWDDDPAGSQPPAQPEPEESFQPPPPPPLPRADALTWLAWVGAVGGPLLYFLLSALGWSWQTWQIGILLGGFLGGFAVLVSRLRDDSPDDADPDQGAVV